MIRNDGLLTSTNMFCDLSAQTELQFWITMWRPLKFVEVFLSYLFVDLQRQKSDQVYL